MVLYSLTKTIFKNIANYTVCDLSNCCNMFVKSVRPKGVTLTVVGIRRQYVTQIFYKTVQKMLHIHKPRKLRYFRGKQTLHRPQLTINT